MLPSSSSWSAVKQILCIRPDNMGDLLMSVPAIRALRHTFGASITLLTASATAPLAAFLPEIDEVITFNTPWVKTEQAAALPAFQQLLADIRERRFDAAVVFTVCSQNPLPSVMIAYLAGIPLRLAYCRENPYALLTDWVPDAEPYTFIRHQVERDLALVASIGASITDDRLSVALPATAWLQAAAHLQAAGVDTEKPWVILHAPVSERKRAFDTDTWIAAGRLLRDELGVQLVLTGVQQERELVTVIAEGIGENAFVLAGMLSLGQFMATVSHAAVVVSVNTSAIHIAAATSRPVVVLYACTNPQHTPWKTPAEVLYFPVPEHLQSKNEVVRYQQRFFSGPAERVVTAEDIREAVRKLLGAGALRRSF